MSIHHRLGAMPSRHPEPLVRREMEREVIRDRERQERDRERQVRTRRQMSVVLSVSCCMC